MRFIRGYHLRSATRERRQLPHRGARSANHLHSRRLLRGASAKIAKTVVDFVTNEVMPAAAEIEAKNFAVTRGLLRKAGELGLMGVDVPEAYGGLELDKVTSAIVAESMSQLASFSVAFSAHVGIGTLPLVWYGTEAQKQQYLPKLVSGEWIAAYALSEASSGSDAMNVRTRAVLSADGECALRSERREDVDLQRRVRRPVHCVRQNRRRKILRLPDRARNAGLLRWPRGAQARHPRLLHLPAHPRRLPGARRKSPGRARQGPPHRLQHPEYRTLQAGRRMRGRRAERPGERYPVCQRAQGVRQVDLGIWLDSGEAGGMRRWNLRGRIAGLSDHRDDRFGAGRRRCARARRLARDSKAYRGVCGGVLHPEGLGVGDARHGGGSRGADLRGLRLCGGISRRASVSRLAHQSDL